MNTNTDPGYRAWLDGVRARMRATREGLGLSFRKAAEQTGVPFGSIERTEAGRVDPSLDTLYRLAVGYGVPVYELLCDGEPPKPGPKKKPGRPPKDAAGH